VISKWLAAVGVSASILLAVATPTLAGDQGIPDTGNRTVAESVERQADWQRQDHVIKKGLVVADAAHDAGVKNKDLETAVAVAYGESHYDPRAENQNHKSGGTDDSYGLWQINMLGALGPDRLAKYGLDSNSDLFDPKVNAEIMYDMSHGGTNFKPWGAYTDDGWEKDVKDSMAEQVVGVYLYHNS
jgi:hypothetical protein